MADVIVHHVSAASPQFTDWIGRGSASPSDGMFLTYAAAFPGGAAQDTLLRIYRYFYTAAEIQTTWPGRWSGRWPP